MIDKYTHKELARNLTREAIQFIFPSDWEEFSEDIIVIKQKGDIKNGNHVNYCRN